MARRPGRARCTCRANDQAERELDARPHHPRVFGRSALMTGKSTGGSAMSTPFSLRAELRGVEVAPGVTLRYWEAGGGRALVMLPGLGHAASLYKYEDRGNEGVFGR